MITVGLIKELLFISTFCNTEVDLETKFPVSDLNINIKSGILTLYYKENLIWKELIEGDSSFFGIESCDAISRIISCIDNGNPSWKEYVYIELDNFPKNL